MVAAHHGGAKLHRARERAAGIGTSHDDIAHEHEAIGVRDERAASSSASSSSRQPCTSPTTSVRPRFPVPAMFLRI